MTSKIMSSRTDRTRWCELSLPVRDGRLVDARRQTNREKRRAGQIYLPPDWDVKQSWEVSWPVPPVVRGNKQPRMSMGALSSLATACKGLGVSHTPNDVQCSGANHAAVHMYSAS